MVRKNCYHIVPSPLELDVTTTVLESSVREHMNKTSLNNQIFILLKFTILELYRKVLLAEIHPQRFLLTVTSCQ